MRGWKSLTRGKLHQANPENLFCQINTRQKVSVSVAFVRYLLGQSAPRTQPELTFLSKSCSFFFFSRSILAFSLLSQESSPESVQTTTRSMEMLMPSSKFFSLKLYCNSNLTRAMLHHGLLPEHCHSSSVKSKYC